MLPNMLPNRKKEGKKGFFIIKRLNFFKRRLKNYYFLLLTIFVSAQVIRAPAMAINVFCSKRVEFVAKRMDTKTPIKIVIIILNDELLEPDKNAKIQ